MTRLGDGAQHADATAPGALPPAPRAPAAGLFFSRLGTDYLVRVGSAQLACYVGDMVGELSDAPLRRALGARGRVAVPEFARAERTALGRRRERRQGARRTTEYFYRYAQVAGALSPP